MSSWQTPPSMSTTLADEALLAEAGPTALTRGRSTFLPRDSSVLSPQVNGALSLLSTSSRRTMRLRSGSSFGSMANTAPSRLLTMHGGQGAYSPLESHGPGDGPLLLGEQDADGSSSFLQSCANGINILLGVGVLSLPYAFRVAGWATAGGLLLLMSLSTCYTGILVGRMMALSPSIRSFSDIGYAAFGRCGQVMITIIFFIELFSACGMYLILCGDNLHALLSPYAGLSQRELTLAAAAVMLPTALTSRLSVLSYFSLIGAFSSMFLAVTVVLVGAVSDGKDPAAGDGSWMRPATTQIWTDLDHAPLAIGLVMVGFAGHACFPSIRCSMRDPDRQFNKVIHVSYAACFSVYAAVAVLGYLMYGMSTAKEITLNIVGNHNASPFVKTISTVATVFIVINPVTKFGLTMNPVALMVQELVLPDVHKSAPNRSSSSLLQLEEELERRQSCCASPRTRSAVTLLIRISLTGTCVATACFLPYFAKVVGFIGAFCSCFVSLIFPVAAYLKIQDMGTCEFILNVTLLVFGTVCSIWGTVVIFLSA